MEKKYTVENKSVEKEDPEPQNSQNRLEKRNLIQKIDQLKKWILNLQNLASPGKEMYYRK